MGIAVCNCSDQNTSMELGAKRKWSRASGSGLAVDRLSALPDCLLHVIMSFMKARQVVQTCALSKRWEHLWRTVPCLDIDQREFQKTGESADKVWENFEDFTDNLMFRHEIARLDMFRLHVNDGLALDEIESHSLKNLVIDDCHRENMDDMDEIDYHSKLIVTAPAIASLYLKSFYFCGGLFVIPEEQVELPEFKNLKILSLDKCDLRDNFQLLMHFLLNSPNLEKITLRLCKLTKDSKKRKGKAKQKKTSLGDIQCQNLKFTEIIYDVDDVLQLVEFLLGYSSQVSHLS
ncbi:hypothetical protein E2562_023210 [Oryza meyeriana var. granulata]|uniref:F-box domain-containing protein n=1 Tax=Oryza meyeriana var. granulata TaxID=110450 RepID=A0A6G1BYJ0_9ORYZ|nr:hypothetical protein E2562_023210 [Oryza meyeriana var. granulata]